MVEKLNIWTGAPNLAKWRRIVKTAQNPKITVNVAVVGKYVNLVDSYKSLHEAIAHGAIANEARVVIDYVDAEELEKGDPATRLADADAIIIPGGFGERGIEGKIRAVRYARENRVPILGICLGLQMMVIENARDLLGLKRANSREFDGRHARSRDRHHGDQKTSSQGRHDAPGGVPVRHQFRVARARRSIAAAASPSAIAIATKSTTPIARRWRRPASRPPAPRPTIAGRDHGTRRAIHGSSAASSIPS